MSPSPTPSRPEDELLEQWSFLDSMVERQATALRAGTQDAEEEDPLPVRAAAPDELADLRRRVTTLERERDGLRAQLEGRDREVQRAQQHSAELMRSLRDAHAAVEEAQQASTAAERRAGAAEESLRAAQSAPAAVQPTGGAGSFPLASSEPRRRSAIFANEDPPAPPARPSFLARLFGRR